LSEIVVENGKVSILSEEVIHNEGSEPMVLGDTLADFLTDFVDEVSRITTATAIGTQPILNIAQVIALKQKINSIKSGKSKLE